MVEAASHGVVFLEYARPKKELVHLDVGRQGDGRFPVSVKGVVPIGDRVLLLRNERAEWELPGGRLELGESPEETLRRELLEETGLSVEIAGLLDCWVFEVLPGRSVVIVTYACRSLAADAAPRLSSEHNAVGFFSPGELVGLPLPDGYRASILRWFEADHL